jgi:hypothetical protein
MLVLATVRSSLSKISPEELGVTKAREMRNHFTSLLLPTQYICLWISAFLFDILSGFFVFSLGNEALSPGAP